MKIDRVVEVKSRLFWMDNGEVYLELAFIRDHCVCKCTSVGFENLPSSQERHDVLQCISSLEGTQIHDHGGDDGVVKKIAPEGDGHG